MADPTSEILLKQVAAGDSVAERELFAHYAPRMVALAARRLSSRGFSGSDAEDVTQSALCCFFAGASDDRWHHAKPGDLWRLLAGIVTNKCRAATRRQLSTRRDIRRERPLVSGEKHTVQSLAARDASPSEQVLLWESASQIYLTLGQVERELLQLKLAGESTEKIARQMSISTRSARRKLADLEMKLKQVLVNSNAEIARSLANQDSLSNVIDQQTFDRVAQLVSRVDYENLLLEQLVGTGGMGKVFRAIFKPTGATVAVKALAKRQHRNPQAVDAFLNEAAILARLRHRHIVPLRALGQFPGGGLFMVMDFVRGENLAQRQARKALTEPEALRIAVDVASAMVAAHACGVIHCDLKPANILLARDGATFVTDFGFAQLIIENEQSSFGNRAPRGGTPAFAAPEQWKASSANITPAIDIYAFGKILIAMLLGRVPAMHEETLMAVEEINGTAAEICRKCTMTDPAQRYASAGNCLATLRELVDASFPTRVGDE